MRFTFLKLNCKKAFDIVFKREIASELMMPAKVSHKTRNYHAARRDVGLSVGKGAGERGVVQNFGAVQEVVLGEGLHFKIPVVQTVIIMDVKIQKVTTDAPSWIL